METRKQLHSGLIGQRLIEAGYLTKEQLREALAEQERTALLLGEVCLLRGWFTFDQLKECLPPLRNKIGNTLLAHKIINMEQLWLALLEQRMSGLKLGEILINRGWAKKADIERAEAARLKDRAQNHLTTKSGSKTH